MAITKYFDFDPAHDTQIRHDVHGFQVLSIAFKYADPQAIYVVFQKGYWAGSAFVPTGPVEQEDVTGAQLAAVYAANPALFDGFFSNAYQLIKNKLGVTGTEVK